MDYRKSSGMIKAAFVLGIISLLSFQLFIVSIPCAALAIILALLSRGGKLVRRAKIAVITAVLGIVISTAFTTYTVYTTIQYYGGFDNLLKAYEDFAHDLGYDIDFGALDAATSSSASL